MMSVETEECNKCSSLFIQAQILNQKREFIATNYKCLKLVEHPIFQKFEIQFIKLLINNLVNLSQFDCARISTNELKKSKRCINCTATTWNQKIEKKTTTRLRKCKMHRLIVLIEETLCNGHVLGIVFIYSLQQIIERIVKHIYSDRICQPLNAY